MRVLIVNSVCGVRSTGKLCAELAERLEKEGHEVKIAYGRDTVPEKYRRFAVRIGNDRSVKLHALKTRLFDEHGFGSKRATKRFLQWAEEFDPDLVWLHNIHGYYIQVELLFAWLKARPNTQVKWTLHDCWSFTGHCDHFLRAECEQWKTHCTRCPQKKNYPASQFKDNCKANFDRKRKAFTGVKNMTLIAPSYWLKGLAEQGFLKEYPIVVEHNQIDRTVFKPTPSDFRQRHGLEHKKIILGVASFWGDNKGLSDFVRLSEGLSEEYKVVLVGLTEEQKGSLPQRLLALGRTNNAKELAEIYTAADIYFNPTYEDNYPTVNLEAQACGTPVVTYDTGGSGESVPPENVIAKGDLQAFIDILEKGVEKLTVRQHWE